MHPQCTGLLFSLHCRGLYVRMAATLSDYCNCFARLKISSRISLHACMFCTVVSEFLRPSILDAATSSLAADNWEISSEIAFVLSKMLAIVTSLF